MAKKTNILPRSGSMVDRLNRLLGVFQGEDKVLIVINADPDAIACAMAVKRLLWRKVASVCVARINVVKRPDNLALIEYIKMPIMHINQVKLDDYTKKVVVDSQPHHLGDWSSIKFDVIIDHHPPSSENKAEFMDIRPNYGACSTILTEYLRAAKIKPSLRLATAMFYAIKTDTDNFVRQGQMEDMRAFRFLFPLKNKSMVLKIENSDITRTALKYFAKALDTVKIRRGSAFVFLGNVDNPDTLVMLADFFMRVHDINQSITAGLYHDRVVVIFRVVGARKNAGKMAAEAFGELGSAGGHKAMARAEMPIENLPNRCANSETAMIRFLSRRLTAKGRSKKASNGKS